MSKLFRLIIIFFIILVLFVAFHYLSWLKPAESLLVKIISPVQSRIYSSTLGVKKFYNNWIVNRDLFQENYELKNKLEKALIDQSESKALRDENNLLKKELNFIENANLNYVSARIISGVSDPLSKSVVINKGKNDGIKKGFAVVAGEGIMIGKVSEVSYSHSKVILLTDNSSIVAATIQNIEQTTGLIEGEFGLSFKMTNIPKNQEIKEGDLVVTSGLEGNIPKNLLIAEIDGVSDVDSEIFKKAVLRPIISFDNLSYVLVVIP